MRLRARVRRLLGMRPSPRVPGVPPAPTVRVLLPVAVPGVLVRLTPAMLVLLCAGTAGAPRWGWVLSAVAAVAVAVRPSWPVVPALMLLVGLWVFVEGDLLGVVTAQDGGLLRMAVLVAAVHLLARTAALAQHVTWWSVVDAAVLRRLLRSVLGVQLVVQTLLLAVVWLRGNLGVSDAGQELVRVVAVAAAVGVLLVVVPRAWLVRRGRRT